MAIRDNSYRNFNNRKSFNGAPLLPGEILVPVLLNKEMRDTLKPLGFDPENAETWTLPYSGKKLKVAFVPAQDTTGVMDVAIKHFNGEVKRELDYVDLGHEDDVLSLDSILDYALDEDKRGFDPTGSTEAEDIAELELALDMLIDELSDAKGIDGAIFKLHAEGYTKREIISKVDIGKGKSRSYEYINKVIERAVDLYDKKYR
ncbi:MAG: hypothetical protein Q4C42_11605 [Clostridia bacterium]|nr:hypothetical protein [Clostridia bacterium]